MSAQKIGINLNGVFYGLGLMALGLVLANYILFLFVDGLIPQALTAVLIALAYPMLNFRPDIDAALYVREPSKHLGLFLFDLFCVAFPLVVLLHYGFLLGIVAVLLQSLVYMAQPRATERFYPVVGLIGGVIASLQLL